MRRHAPLALLLLATAGATLGCYESDLPLGKPSATTIDPRLVGHWRCVFPHADTPSSQTMTIARRGEEQYDVSLDAQGEDTIRYRGHGVDVRGTTIVNLQEVKPERDPAAGRWDFVRATLLTPNVLHVEVVDDKLFLEKPRTAEAQRAIVEASIDLPALFSEYCVCARVVADK